MPRQAPRKQAAPQHSAQKVAIVASGCGQQHHTQQSADVRDGGEPQTLYPAPPKSHDVETTSPCSKSPSTQSRCPSTQTIAHDVRRRYAEVLADFSHQTAQTPQGTHTPTPRSLTASLQPPTRQAPFTQTSPRLRIPPVPSRAAVRHRYDKGDILRIPVHEPTGSPTGNRNPKQLENIIQTAHHGYVYSDHRLAVVLLAYESCLQCLPLYTWSNRGIPSRKKTAIGEYVGVKNAGHAYVNHGKYEPVELSCAKPMEAASTIQLSAVVKVDFCNRPRYVGRLTERQWEYLMGLYLRVQKEAKDKPWQGGQIVNSKR